MGAITDLFKSERGILAVAIIVAATVLAALGSLPIADWKTFVTYIFGIYVGGKTITSAVGILKGTPELAAPAAPVIPTGMTTSTVEVKS
jgi:hypothetical protein